MKLEKYRIPLQLAPQRIQNLVSKGVNNNDYPATDGVRSILDVETTPEEGVWRAEDGRVLIVCNTDFPNSSAAMLDWWFGWHLPDSQRYQLWHPKAHVGCKVMEDRSHLDNDRARYINNKSYVDEYIGTKLKRLTIQFIEPSMFGLNDLDQRKATAICGYTHDRTMRARGGQLCHLILPTGSGCQMRSGFWLGDIHHHLDVVHAVMKDIYNSAFARSRIISDDMVLNLLLHCSEEMNHLAKILPGLYNEFASPVPSSKQAQPA